MPKTKQETDIDLQCILCPKDPKFSDVSHLLTHISSKAHLSHRFKLEIRAQTEPESRDKLNDFAFWYNQNNLDALLAERLALKDNKKMKKVRGSDHSDNFTATKKEKKSKSASVKEVLAHTPVFRAPVPRMQDWPSEDRTRTSAMDDDWEPHTMYTTPTARRRVPNFTRLETPASSKVDPSLTTPVKLDLGDPDYTQNQKPGEKLTDSAKLKGVIWPGMDLFDSATPEMKRMRNQRKDHTVLEDMIATSLASEPAEVSFHANGDFRGSRDIFGPLSAESSPARSVPSPKKRKVRQTNKALSNVSTNAPRMRASRAKKGVVAAPSPQKRQAASMSTRAVGLFPAAPLLNPLANIERRYVPTAEEDEEFRLTVGDMTKKRGFTIFQDIPEVSPGRTETPLEDHRFELFGSHGLPTFPNNSMNSNHTLASPTPVPRPTMYRASGKENGQAEMLTYHPNRRALSDSQVYPPHAYHEGVSNPLFHQNYARTYGYGGGPFGYTGFGDARSPSGFGSNFITDFNRQPNPMANMSQQQSHSMGPRHDSTTTSGNNFGI
ncbi:hypothetical protein ONS95_008143 [Cadophora gregata]|uniref:uncharacterized protein n=1 Tax=Cadophora gregata TaxID=51156 RepID=UPI0026DC2B52|nr:uncharacterized protein ONS95_008143 [Cadophora gregata]KAK0119296.1 hypothetical protein ONS96_012354 [Cadophora gregata f. sp. sojae]KAK0126551.1 hypothetical protein ONS95_008143 [Cadophora gregata]